MINLTINKLRSIMKCRNVSGYTNMPKHQLINLLTKPVEQFISKLLRKELTDYRFYNYGHYFRKLKMNVMKF